ncbi:MAG: amino acid ABC transporter substrate-binding protein, partial [Luteimonas sp.]
GELFVEQLNKNGGLLGRQVKWLVKDDQSKPELARTLYEQLITVDKVDLLIGPYATGNILAAMGVAQRYNRLFVHSSFGLPHLAKYDMQFSTNGMGFEPGVTYANTVYDALAASAKPPRTVAVVTSKFPSTHSISVGARKTLAKRGLKEVLFLEWEFGSRDFGPIASRLKDANPDFVWVGAVGLEGNLLLEAMKKIAYTPGHHMYLFPAPGPMAGSPDAKNALASTIFEPHAPFISSPVAAQFAREFTARATKAGLPYSLAETQAAGIYAGWQVLTAAVKATNSLDDKTLAQWLKKNKVDTVVGSMRFDGPNNYGDDLFHVKQVQGGKWVTVWPRSKAAPGVKLQTR